MLTATARAEIAEVVVEAATTAWSVTSSKSTCSPVGQPEEPAASGRAAPRPARRWRRRSRSGGTTWASRQAISRSASGPVPGSASVRRAWAAASLVLGHRRRADAVAGLHLVDVADVSPARRRAVVQQPDDLGPEPAAAGGGDDARRLGSDPGTASSRGAPASSEASRARASATSWAGGAGGASAARAGEAPAVRSRRRRGRRRGARARGRASM